MSSWGNPGPPNADGDQPEQGQPKWGAPQQPGQGPASAGSPYGQPFGGQPPFGQSPAYGQPPYGQPPAYGQPPYGQPSYGQPSFGPPAGFPNGSGMPPAYQSYGVGSGANGAVGPRASMGARFGGLVIDSLLVGIVASIFIIPLGGYSSASTCSNGSCATHFSINPGATLFTLVLGIVYSAVLVGLKTQTIGHRAVGIKVVDSNDGSAIGPVRGGLRWLVMAVTGAIFTLGYWSPFFDHERRRGWHDKASNAIAVSTR